MEEACDFPPGLKQANLKKSFKLGIRSLLTACSKEEFLKAFPTLDKAKQEYLYQLFIQVIASLHDNVEEEFESICFETKVGVALDTVEGLVEEKSLDVPSDDTAICYLTNMLKMVAQHNQDMRVRVESLKKEKQDSLVSTDVTEKVYPFKVLLFLVLCSRSDLLLLFRNAQESYMLSALWKNLAAKKSKFKLGAATEGLSLVILS
ncbi:hypothetical protein Sjap_006165 [Stephania japonica]|uniref:Uncharacterized protein n=1 Tax=Stephania japonica TaxID=461633 RepID=A0AAP0K5E7_9MAGN